MKQILKKRYLGLLVLAFFIVQTPVHAMRGSLPDFTDLVKKASPAIVNISTSRKVSLKEHMGQEFQMPDIPEDAGPLGDLFKHFFGEGEGFDQEFDTASLGSGFFISSDGYIVTNNHVIQKADEIIVRLSDRREFIAELVGSDAKSDIALLKIDAKNTPTLELGKSSDLEVGEWVLAIGAPFGFDHSATAGIVSAKGRSLPNENYVPFIQTDVAINPGNSGGPLFNLDGEVVGINAQIYSQTGGFMGVSFAIPIDVATDIVQQLKTSGKVTRGWLGVYIQEVTRELAESFGMDQPRGALVAQVLPESPALKSGLKVGDIILSFDGSKIMRSSDLPPLVGRKPVGHSAQVKVLRNGKPLMVRVRIGKLPEDDAMASADGSAKPMPKSDVMGMTLLPAPKPALEELGIDNGVLVEKVGTGAARTAGVRPGDVIVMVQQQPVKSPDQFRKYLNDLPKGKSVALLVQRKEGPVFLALKKGK